MKKGSTLSDGDCNTHQYRSEPFQPNNALCPSCSSNLVHHIHRLCVVGTDLTGLSHLGELVQGSCENYVIVAIAPSEHSQSVYTICLKQEMIEYKHSVLTDITVGVLHQVL